jgi:hypothetical protein
VPLYSVGIYIRTWWRVAYKNENKDQGQIISFLSVVCGPITLYHVPIYIHTKYEGIISRQKSSAPLTGKLSSR